MGEMVQFANHHASILLGLLAAGALVFTKWTNSPKNRHPDAEGAAWAMVGIWGLTMAAKSFLAPPNAEMIGPIVDAMLAAGITLAWTTRREGWKLLLLGLLGIQCELHVIYQTDYLRPGMLTAYRLGLNLTFIAELLCVCWPGVGYVLERRAGIGLRDHRSGPPSVGAR